MSAMKKPFESYDFQSELASLSHEYLSVHTAASEESLVYMVLVLVLRGSCGVAAALAHTMLVFQSCDDENR